MICAKKRNKLLMMASMTCYHKWETFSVLPIYCTYLFWCGRWSNNIIKFPGAFNVRRFFIIGEEAKTQSRCPVICVSLMYYLNENLRSVDFFSKKHNVDRAQKGFMLFVESFIVSFFMFSELRQNSKNGFEHAYVRCVRGSRNFIRNFLRTLCA